MATVALTSPGLSLERPTVVAIFESSSSISADIRRTTLVSSSTPTTLADVARPTGIPSLDAVPPENSGDARIVPLQMDLAWNAPEHEGEQIGTDQPLAQVGPVALTGLVAASGYVLLNTRAGYWVLSLLMSRPLWKQFDPMEVLFAWEKEGKGAKQDRDEHEETLVSLVE
jgi:hypothetical protein